MSDAIRLEDLEAYAKFLGLDNGEFEVFYESYYGIETNEDLEELLQDLDMA